MTKRQHTPHPAAKDLAHEQPVPMDASSPAIPWLPRIIDKARTSHAGTLGTYYRYPCPIDAVCLVLLDIDADTFRQIADRAVDDHAVINNLASIGALVERLASFDPVQLNAELHREDA
jgi:hypothetical protein